MNSLNIVSRLTATPPSSPPRTRTSSGAETDTVVEHLNENTASSATGLDAASLAQKLGLIKREDTGQAEEDPLDAEVITDEKTPLLEDAGSEVSKSAQRGRGWQLPRRIVEAVFYGVKVVFTTITAPGRYVIACFYDEKGHFSAIMPLRNLRNLMFRRKRKSTAQTVGVDSASEDLGSVSDEKTRLHRKTAHTHRRSPSVESTASTASAASSDGEADDSPARHTRSKSVQHGDDDAAPLKKSIRIKEHNSDALRKRKSQKPKKATSPEDVAAIASALKSPSSAATSNELKLTRYPRAPAPPRPLVPRRQPSYTLSYAPDTPKKTLIIDLDETLIHSMAKGGRMSTGHMVEVRLGGPVSSSGFQIGPGVPILYYVHERPNCHEFLRKVCKWYNLVVFTASVQEYADPVIDWLERERKYFSGRYYRQHCTFRNGAYIKDLAQVEPDLSKVMILDNSPMSYIFHEDNAIPIEGWISDPTDNDLLHLVPLFEGLQYVTDVRALLALRQGQAQQA